MGALIAMMVIYLIALAMILNYNHKMELIELEKARAKLRSERDQLYRQYERVMDRSLANQLADEWYDRKLIEMKKG